MKEDLKIILAYLLDFTDTFQHSTMYLYGEEEDSEMLEKIRKIRKKYKID